MRAGILLVVVVASSCGLHGQSVYQQGDQVIYQDASNQETLLGRGHDPLPLPDGKILWIQGAKLNYGDRFACTNPKLKNTIALYDPVTHGKSILYDKPIVNDIVGPEDGCVFNQADLSPDGSSLYIVTPWAATSGMLTIINLRNGKVVSVAGVDDVYVIRGGSAEGGLIYTRRLWKEKDAIGAHPYYPFVHARPDGSQIAIISDESFEVGGTAKTPILRSFLRGVRGRIYVQGDAYARGKWIP